MENKHLIVDHLTRLNNNMSLICHYLDHLTGSSRQHLWRGTHRLYFTQLPVLLLVCFNPKFLKLMGMLLFVMQLSTIEV